MREINIQLEVENLEELKQLLQKATSQIEQLQKTLNQITEFKVTTKADLKT